jgi:hypothetical protein
VPNNGCYVSRVVFRFPKQYISIPVLPSGQDHQVNLPAAAKPRPLGVSAIKSLIMAIGRSVGLGIMFCLTQSLGESILSYWFISLKGTSNINFEGMILYSFIRIILTAIPYILLFWLAFQLRKARLIPAFIALSINVLVLLTFYLLDIYQKEPATIVLSSMLLSITFLALNKTIINKIAITVN